MASFLPNFFPQPKHRQFDIHPRYYDPEKERLDNLKKKYETQTPEDEKLAEAKIRIRESFQREQKRPKGLLSNRKLLIYLVILMALLWWVLK